MGDLCGVQLGRGQRRVWHEVGAGTQDGARLWPKLRTGHVGSLVFGIRLQRSLLKAKASEKEIRSLQTFFCKLTWTENEWESRRPSM